jgi:two-component system response regulator HydG
VSARVLVVDDDDGVRFTLAGLLEDAGFAVEQAKDGEEALERIAAGDLDAVVSDLRMPKVDGLALLERLRERGLDGASGGPRVVVVTAHGSERHAVHAMKLGAYDYFHKPFEPHDVLASVSRAVEATRLKTDNERLTSELALSKQLLFASPAMARVAALVRRVAPKDVTVLVTGESGTGKERVAEAIVAASKRAAAPFVRFNCAALSPELAEAELFGHARGAFTGAVRARAGLFREAHGGTLFLDEIGEIAPTVQAKLLRAIQEGEVRPVGEDRAERVDVRVIAATNRDLGALVRAGKFREDLLFRIRVVELQLPPLRERPEDVALLAREFLRRAAARFGVRPVPPSASLMDALARHPWPGNVRELENAMESLVALSPEGTLDPAFLPVADAPTKDETAEGTLRQRVEAYERGLLVTALETAGGNRSRAARALGIGRATLHEKMQKYGLGKGDDD